jgi:hypothetical protein
VSATFLSEKNHLGDEQNTDEEEGWRRWVFFPCDNGIPPPNLTCGFASISYFVDFFLIQDGYSEHHCGCRFRLVCWLGCS